MENSEITFLEGKSMGFVDFMKANGLKKLTPLMNKDDETIRFRLTRDDGKRIEGWLSKRVREDSKGNLEKYLKNNHKDIQVAVYVENDDESETKRLMMCHEGLAAADEIEFDFIDL